MVTHMTPDKTDKGGYITAAAYEGDIVSRLRNWRGLHLAHSGELFDEAADEMDRLRSAYATAVQRLASEIARLRLTDEEREAVETARSIFEQGGDEFDHDGDRARAVTLRGLLDRLA